LSRFVHLLYASCRLIVADDRSEFPCIFDLLV